MKRAFVLAIAGFFVFFGLVSGQSVTADSTPGEPADDLAAVWNLSAQPCNGDFGNAMERHPDEAAIKESRTITLENLGYQFTVPQLPDVEKTYLKVFLEDHSRGVIDHYLLISDQDLEPQFAAVVITELPENLQSPEQAFNAVHVLEGQLSEQAGITPNLEPIDSPFGKALEMLVDNRVGSHCFPTSTFIILPPGADVSTIGISRFAMINKRLVEFALIVVIPEGTADAEAREIARQAMDSFWLSFKAS